MVDAIGEFNMKKKILIISLIVIVLIIGVCLFRYFIGPIGSYIGPNSKYRGQGTEPYNKYHNVVFNISREKECIPVSLYLYDDGTYELFTEYEACRPWQSCLFKLNYTKSIKGTYDYDVTKILDESIKVGNFNGNSKDIEYTIFAAGLGTTLDEEYSYDYVITKDKINKPLEELLKKLNIGLDVCAIPDYNK